MAYKIIDSTWWTPPMMLPGSLYMTIIGAVAIETRGKKWKAYLGVGLGVHKKTDEQKIASLGAKLTPDQAAGIFPQLDIDRYAP